MAATSYLPPPDAGPGVVQAPSIAVDDTQLYYAVNLKNLSPSAGSSGGIVARIPIRGGVPKVIASLRGGGVSGSQELAVSSTGIVYAVETDASGDGGGAVMSASLTSGMPTLLAATSGPPSAIVADVRNAYFVDRDGLKRVALGGGPVVAIADVVPFSLAVIGSNVVLADWMRGIVSQVPVEGGTLSVLATQQAPLYPIFCAPDLCWLNESARSAKIVRLVDGGLPVTVADEVVLNEPHGLAFDGKSFFVTSGAGIGYLTKISAAGMSRRLLNS